MATSVARRSIVYFAKSNAKDSATFLRFLFCFESKMMLLGKQGTASLKTQIVISSVETGGCGLEFNYVKKYQNNVFGFKEGSGYQIG